MSSKRKHNPKAEESKGKGRKRSSSSSAGGTTGIEKGDDGDVELDFQDPFVEEYEDEDVVGEDEERHDDDSDDDEDDDDMDDAPRAWRSGVDPIAADEELIADLSVYNMLHQFHAEWPCLSFDLVRDHLGFQRKKYPHTMYIMAGTQATTPQQNKLVLMKLSDLGRTGHDAGDDSDDDSDTEDDPVLESKEVSHPDGGVNRVRCMPQQPTTAATWSDSGKVHIWNMAQHMKALEGAGGAKLPTKPMYSFDGHDDEGYALDWSSAAEGKLLSGSCDHTIRLHQHNEGKWTTDPTPFEGHTDSVEDVQWSPAEPTVFASCSVDKTIRIWDTRAARDKSALTVTAHEQDVNVISWNKIVTFLLLSGSDDGTFKVWDLRKMADQPVVGHFTHHKGNAVTSVAWHPSDESALAVSVAGPTHNMVTLWDLSMERDDETPNTSSATTEEDLPPQLLFVHQGQRDIKEIHWHPQVPGALVSTAADGFNIFKTINM
eukprot:TRINITY_DN1222_c4_g1_i1.p1 TRINITY_DN1222_c4_g1~~TRINITY_DN1222_c4_g1_i1.p1  ORF type:complete len:497 (-),score=107.98 TRINITY_DN1222_c4_g1_i1:119-1579(-)